jgi:hypothetical protein
MNIEIGTTVRFIALNSNMQGTVTNIADRVAFIAVLGYSGTFPIQVGALLPVVKE